MSDQTPIAFHDVAAYFTKEQWMRLEDWQKERYLDVMKEIHEALISLGYTITNPDILFKIKKKDESCVQIDYDSAERENTCIADLPDILIRIKEESLGEIPYCEENNDFSERHNFGEPNTRLPNTQGDNSFLIKMEEEIDLVDYHNSVGVENSISPATGSVVVKQEEVNPIDHDDMNETEFTDHHNTHSWINKEYRENKHLNDFPGTQFENVDWSESPQGKSYICSECGKSFLGSSSLSRHRKIHKGELPFKCVQCDKCFSGMAELLLHQRRTHTGERPYTCSQCQKSYINQSTLNKHQKTHTGERPYACDQCDKCFSHNYHLLRHRRVHTGERPFQCSLCDKRFYRKATLEKHQVVHSKLKIARIKY
ncbi:zinc finger protein 777-like isoform X3 [Ascaphus truei]|uniref:zinc finger protein 777-like isoform X3 n=1 Tax=Ascaphus truei TaxID=8439 RepID=UPI003F5AB5DD